MKRITIGGKEYTFKFSVAASLYSECTETIIDSFATGGIIASTADSSDIDGTVKRIVSSVANIPKKAITLFYAGLLENHNDEIRSMNDAKKLIGQYLEENRDAEGNWQKSFVDVFEEMLEIMGDDNFFALTGLNKTLENLLSADEKPRRTRRKKSENGEITSMN